MESSVRNVMNLALVLDIKEFNNFLKLDFCNLQCLYLMIFLRLNTEK